MNDGSMPHSDVPEARFGDIPPKLINQIPDPTVAALGYPRGPTVPTRLSPSERLSFSAKPGTPKAAVPNAATVRQTDAPASFIAQIAEIWR
jgi:hypothetical protein